MISSSYLMLIVATLVIGMGAQWYVNHKLKTYSHVANSTGLTGAEAALSALMDYAENILGFTCCKITKT